MATPVQWQPRTGWQHFLDFPGVPREAVEALLARADEFRRDRQGGKAPEPVLAGYTVANLFFEASTRTRSSFQIAARRLGAEVLNLDTDVSSLKKGETAADTLATLAAMGIEAFAVRHPEDGAVAALAASAPPGVSLVNAGDGRSAHPTQGLLDALAIMARHGEDFSRLSVAIVGDLAHSRVARSDVGILRLLGCRDLRVCAPPALRPEPGDPAFEGTIAIDRADEAVAGCDVVITLRLQRERMASGLAPPPEDYFRDYGIDRRRMALAAPGAIVMHPGPMNRGIEIADAVADGPQSAVLQQVACGVFARMAVLEALLTR